MYDFIRNPPKSIGSNSYAKNLYKKWKVMMMSFNFSDTELDAMMKFWEKEK
jgi:hypothetical protein